MKKKYSKLTKLFKAKTLTSSQIDAHRDCDAFIASLLDWKHIDLDLNKEWSADIPGVFKKFNCVGRCIVPKFTDGDYTNLMEYIITTKMKPTDNFLINITSEGLHCVLTRKNKVVKLQAPTMSLIVSRLFVELCKK